MFVCDGLMKSKEGALSQPSSPEKAIQYPEDASSGIDRPRLDGPHARA
jgi:hypothetical protein